MDDQTYATAVRDALLGSISHIDHEKYRFLAHPERDFTRERRLPFRDILRICIQMEGKTLQNELLGYFDFGDGTPSKSALCQQRAKVPSEAFRSLYDHFTEAITALDVPKTFHGYRLLACDGTDVNIPYHPADTQTFHKHGSHQGYNQLHLDAFYDLLNGIYIDSCIQTKDDERAALLSMADRYTGDAPAIIIADRGYEGYEPIVRLIRSPHHFIIRLKDIGSNGILSTHDLPDGAFDLDLETLLTKRQTKEVKEHRDIYTIIAHSTPFSFIDEDTPCFPLKLRLVRMEVAPGVYACVATDLDREDFPPAVIQELYRMRWDIEGAFRELKYTIDLVHFHGVRRLCVEQEIWSRLILYNFSEAIIRHTTVTRQTGIERERKYTYKIVISTAVRICREFLKRGDGEYHPCRLIGRYLTPIRPDRSAPRKVRSQSAKCFLYRAA